MLAEKEQRTSLERLGRKVQNLENENAQLISKTRSLLEQLELEQAERRRLHNHGKRLTATLEQERIGREVAVDDFVKERTNKSSLISPVESTFWNCAQTSY